MSAFDRILSGFPDVDRLLDNIRLGDNVVWRVKSLDQFRYFAEPFAERAIADGRTTVYMKFAGHEPLLAPRPGLKIREFDPDKGFEAFTVDIYNCITENGREAFYVFDSLSAARMACRQGNFSGDMERQIIESTMTKDSRLQEMLRKYFEPRDYFLLRDRMAGSGSIGGKACGMLLARKIVRKELPGCGAYLEPHDSFYIGSDVFYTYIVSNSCWELRIAQRTQEGYFSRAKELREALLVGEFPPNIREKFRSILEYFGQSPIIVRSSSFLEDGFGNACADTGLMRETERRDRYGNDYGNAGGTAAQGPSGSGAQGGSAGHQGGGRSPGGLLPEVPGAGI